LKNKIPNIYIVTGDVHQGKTSFVQKVVEELCAKNMEVGGFLSVGNLKHGHRSGFVLRTLSDGRDMELCSDEPHKNWLKFRRFYFNPNAIALGNKILIDEAQAQTPLVLVDEIGPMELNEAGWFPGIAALQTNFRGTQIWVVRRTLVDDVKHFFQVQHSQIIDISKQSPQALIHSLALQEIK
jgi:nucleoside-triphosphatase THEP1